MRNNITFYSNPLVIILLVLILLSTGMLYLVSTCYAQSPWIQKADMPTARFGHSSSVLDGKIYAIGGVDYQNYNSHYNAFAMLEVYDPILDTWDTTKADMTTARASFATCVLNGKILAIGGGQSFYWDPLISIEEYDPVTDTWTHKTNMPRPRMGLTASLVDGKIYIIGGANSNSEISLARVDVYDPLTNTWTTAADLPTPRFNLQAVVLNGKIYAIGGHLGSSHWDGLNTVEVYDPTTDTWTTKAPMITGRKYYASCALNGKIYVFGGSKGIGIGPPPYQTLSVEEYDPTTDTWIERTSLPGILTGASAASFDGKIYLSGGSPKGPDTDTAVSTMYEYDPHKDLFPLVGKLSVNKSYAKPGIDSVLITVKISDPTGITLLTEIEAPDQIPVDSLQLYDDGNHKDGNAGDSLYANIWPILSTEEQQYYVDLHVTRIDTDTAIHQMNNMAFFTTIGPVKASAIDVHYSEQARSQFIKLVLHNEGAVATAENLGVTISTNDPRVEEKIFGAISFPDVAAGITDTSNLAFYFNYAAGYGPDSTLGNPILFDYTISSNKIDYWTGSFDFTATITGIDDKQLNTVPQKFKLYQNYPNPFNPSTMIDYYLPVSTKVTLKIYNLAGQEIEMLVNEFQTIGVHQITWQPKSLPNGLYFCKLQAGKFSDTRKLILQK